MRTAYLTLFQKPQLEGKEKSGIVMGNIGIREYPFAKRSIGTSNLWSSQVYHEMTKYITYLTVCQDCVFL